MQYLFHRVITAPPPDSYGPISESLGGAVFACTQQAFSTDDAGANKFTGCFDPDDKKYWGLESVNTDSWYWAKFYSPEAFTLASIELKTQAGLMAPSKVRLYGGISDSAYELITADVPFEAGRLVPLPLNDNIKPYKFYKLEVQPSNTDTCCISTVKYSGSMIQSLGAYFVSDDLSLLACAPCMKDATN